MKNFTLLLLGVVICLSFSIEARSQRSPTQRNCGTMEWMDAMFRENPGSRSQYAASERLLGEAVARKMQDMQANPNRTHANYLIPTVFHVVLTSAQHAALTDAMILDQLTILNQDFSGLNPDSTNVPPEFQAVRGHSGIQFCMARRTPVNTPTVGIVRVVSSTLSTSSQTNDPVKSTAAGGSDAWDPSRYVNIWLCNFSNPSLLGYASFPIGTSENPAGPVNQQGVAVLAQSVPGGTAAPFDGGRTLTHELGHFFWLRHMTGDANCGDDFPGTPGIDDTPQQSNLTGGCPTGAVASGCAASPNPPGRMYQNYMDYTDDACMTMFTIGQGIRAEQALLTFRATLAASNGCSPIVTVPNDAGISVILTPVAGSNNACVPITPVVTLTNFGTNALTSVLINVELGGVPVPGSPFNWVGNLSPGGSTNVTLTTTPVTPALGPNSLHIFTTLPNTVADGEAGNDGITISFNRVNGVPLPVVDGFEGATYPLPGWTSTAWQKVNYAASSGTNSIKADFWNFGTGTTLTLNTPEIDVAGEPTVIVKFDISHKQWPGAQDRLEVRVTNNCGTSFTTVYNKTSSGAAPIPSAPALVTTTGGGTLADGGFVPNGADQWRTEQLNLTGAILSAGHIQISFRGTSNFGNNLYVDNINIDKIYPRDLTVTAITKPGVAECGPFAPVATVQNVGIETVTAYTVTYRVDAGPVQSTTVNTAIAPGATANVTLGNISPAAGNHTITICTLNPVAASGTGDQNTANDCRTKAFEMKLIVSAPLVEGFEAASFPSPGWSVINPNNNITFIRRPPGYQSVNSAFIDNYSTDLTGQSDFIQSPAFSVQGAGGVLADSVIVTWDLAYQTFPGLSDELSVRTSADCGNTFTNVIFVRSGLALAGPAGANTAAYLAPIASHWQHLRAATGAPNLAAGHMITTFRNLQGFGNNLFLDNINIQVLFKRDLKVMSVDKPANIECTGNFTPSATVKNNGIETITGFTISYSVDNGAAQNTTVTGISLARDATMSVNLTPAIAGLAPGQHSIRVYSANPITVSGTGDHLTSNDTLVKTFGITGITAAPLTEGFESTTFPPTGWAFTNPDGDITWSKANVGKNSAGSATVRNYAYTSQNRVDELYSPSVTYNGVDSIQLSFDIAAATYNYPGTTNISIDTMEVLVTKNCGNTYTSIWKKWGEELQTINDPNYPQTVEFIPASADQWRNEVIDLTGGFTPNGPLQVIFRNTNNFENNIYIDNVNLTTKTLPASLKELGYLILPNPFTDQFTIWHLITPTNLRYASVYNSAGQLVWKQEFHGNATKQTTVDLTGKPAGTYIVNLGYEDRQRNVQVKVIKM